MSQNIQIMSRDMIKLQLGQHFVARQKSVTRRDTTRVIGPGVRSTLLSLDMSFMSRKSDIMLRLLYI